MKKLISAFLSLALLAPIVGCVADNKPMLGTDYQIKNIQQSVASGHESDPMIEYCKSFSLTDDKIRKFFSTATQISRNQLHNDYDLAPCLITGQIVQNGETMHFEIYASAVGKIDFALGQEKWFGCKKKCDALFSNKK